MLESDILDLVRKPLNLSSDAILIYLNGGTINQSFQLTDANQNFFLKRYIDTEIFGLNRKHAFSSQLELHKYGLAPRPLFLSNDEQIYVEEWVDLPKSQIAVEYDELHLRALASALVRVHQFKLEGQILDLSSVWKRYLNTADDEALRIRCEALTQEWQALQIDSEDITYCHNDLAWSHLCPGSKLILDWEYASNGNRFFDIMSCARVNGLESDQIDSLLTFYAQLANLDVRRVKDKAGLQSEFVKFTSELWYSMLNDGTKLS